MMIILGTLWGFVPKERKITCWKNFGIFIGGSDTAWIN